MNDSGDGLIVACPSPSCRLTDMRVSRAVLGRVVRCVCHARWIVVEIRDGQAVARLATPDEIRAATQPVTGTVA